MDHSLDDKEIASLITKDFNSAEKRTNMKEDRVSTRNNELSPIRNDSIGAVEQIDSKFRLVPFDKL